MKGKFVAALTNGKIGVIIGRNCVLLTDADPR